MDETILSAKRYSSRSTQLSAFVELAANRAHNIMLLFKKVDRITIMPTCACQRECLQHSFHIKCFKYPLHVCLRLERQFSSTIHPRRSKFTLYIANPIRLARVRSSIGAQISRRQRRSWTHIRQL